MLLSLAVATAAELPAGPPPEPPPPGWDTIPAVRLNGGLKLFWDVGCRDRENAAQALAHGFLPVDLLNSYADYPGQQRENIATWLKGNPANPWKKPDFFERICRRNIGAVEGRGAIFVHDIEFPFEQEVEKAWADPAVRAASGAKTLEEFSPAYWREWATWFWQPCQWAKERFPETPVGIYGIQPFRRDYWGVAGKDARQIDGTHANDALLWQRVDPHVDFYVASIYAFYEDPGSVYYMAANVEENWQRSRRFGDKPVYAYEWLRYHDSNPDLAGRELAPWLVEAMAVLPFFSGGSGVVLWGWEPKVQGQPYRMLPVFMDSIRRVAELSDRIGRATLEIDEPAHVLWKEKRPLVRKLQISAGEWIVLGIDPWQEDTASREIAVRCGEQTVTLTLQGRHTGIFHIRGGSVAKR